MLALYTDGITEAINNGQEFGEEMLLEKLREHRRLSCDDLVRAVAEDVCNFSPHEQHDDITLIVAKGR